MNDLCDKPSQSIGIETFMFVVCTSRVLQGETKKPEFAAVTRTTLAELYSVSFHHHLLLYLMLDEWLQGSLPPAFQRQHHDTRKRITDWGEAPTNTSTDWGPLLTIGCAPRLQTSSACCIETGMDRTPKEGLWSSGPAHLVRHWMHRASNWC